MAIRNTYWLVLKVILDLLFQHNTQLEKTTQVEMIYIHIATHVYTSNKKKSYPKTAVKLKQ